MYRVILIFVIILFSSSLFSQYVQEEWINTIQDLSGLDIELDENNNVYVLTSNYSLIKYDSNGNELWNATYEDSTGGENAVDFEIDYDNNICITGYKNGIDSWNDIVTVKFDSNGNQLWDMVYQSPSWANTSKPIGLGTDNSGNIYVTGYSYYSTEFTGYSRSVTIKYDQYGNEEWTSLYEPIYDNWLQPSAIAVDESGTVFITGGDGSKSGQIVNYNSFVTFKYDTDGVMQWDNFYSTTIYFWAFAEAITLDSTNNIYISGSFWDEEGARIITIKYSEVGEMLWESSTPLSIGYNPIDIVTDLEHNVILTVEGYSSGGKLIKYDSSGIELWAINTFNSNDVIVDQNGFIYISGYLNLDYATSKYNQTGSQEWLIQYNGVEDLSDYSKAITLDNYGNAYITGRCRLENYGSSCVTIKYSQSTSVNQGNMIIQDNRLSNHPNPFNPSTTIEFYLQNDSNVELSIYNIKGQKIKTLAYNEFNAGSHSVIWTGDNESGDTVSSGFYLYKLKVNDKIEAVKKCLLVK